MVKKTQLPAPTIGLYVIGIVYDEHQQSTRPLVDQWEFDWTPVPETLNLQVGREIAELVAQLPDGMQLHELDGTTGIYHRMVIGDLDVAVRAFDTAVVVLAPVNLRSDLHLDDGDTVFLEWEWPPDSTI